MESAAREVPRHKAIKLEIVVVLALSLGASAVYSIWSLLAKLTAPAGLAGSASVINESVSEREWVDAGYQLLGIALGMAPVALVLYLLWREYGSDVLAKFGFIGSGATRDLVGDLLRGLALAAAIGIPGLALYTGARLLGLSAKVVPTAINEHWWVPALLLLLALKAAMVEELIAVGYLFERLRALGFGSIAIVVGSAALRGSYHLYQGVGGFVGNFVMGLVFGVLFLRWQRAGRAAIVPLMAAHFTIDAVVFVGYSLVDLTHVLP